MKVCEANGVLETSSNMSRNEFGIKASRKAFEILSSGLYSDKVRAVIRELSTNAADSHIAAKCPQRPFLVHLPNRLEPFFSVRDFGTGMSDEEVLTLYTTYFASNRSSSDDFTGCLGLGSKSPFCYTEQFVVDSWYEGFKTTYSCFHGEDGKPNVAEIGCEETSEENGVEVKFPVQAAHFEEFRTKAVTVLSRFNPRPEVVGNAGFKFMDYPYLLQKAQYGLHKSHENSYVVMGNVAYPICASDFGNLAHLSIEVLNHGVDIFVRIGEVEVTASREKLAYTKATVEALRKLLDEIVKDIQAEALHFLDGVKTIWEARVKLSKFQVGILGRLLPANITWEGKKLSTNILTSDFCDAPVMEDAHTGRGRRHSSTEKLRRTKTKSFGVTEPLYILNDMQSGNYSAAYYYMRQNGIISAIIFSSERGLPDSTLANKPSFDECGVQEVWVRTSSMPKPPVLPPEQRAGSDRRPYTPLLIWKDPGAAKLAPEKYWEPVKKDLLEGGVYEIVCRNRLVTTRLAADSAVLWPDGMYPHKLHEIMELMKTLGTEVKQLYGIRPSDLERLKKLKKSQTPWLRLVNMAETVRKQQRGKLHKHTELANALNYLKFRSTLRDMTGLIPNLPVKSVFRKLLEIVKEAVECHEDAGVRAYRDLTVVLQKQDGIQNIDQIETIREEAFKKYPLLGILNWISPPNGFAEGIASYIKAMDK